MFLNKSGRPAIHERMLTLRQIEVIRAVMVAGTINGAAKLLNVSAPGISRLMKHTEKSLGFRLFDRRQGRYVPAAEANDVFSQINAVYKKVEDLQFTVKRLESGRDLRAENRLRSRVSPT